MKCLVGVVLTCVVLATGIVVKLQEYPHAFPRAGIEKFFENERVSVWDATWPDGVEQPYNRHRYDMTGVFFSWGPLRVTQVRHDESEDVLFISTGTMHVSVAETGSPRLMFCKFRD